MIVRAAIVLREFPSASRPAFRLGDLVHIVTRTGSDEEARETIAETLRDTSPMHVHDFQLLPGSVVLTDGVATIITAEARDPELWEETRMIARALGISTLR